MIELILKITILIWPFGQFLRFNLFNINFYLLDLSVLILTLSIIIFHRQKVIADRLFKPLMFFNLIATISLILASLNLDLKQTTYASLYLVRLWIYPSLYFASKQITFEKIKSSITASLAIFLLLGLGQYLLLPDVRDLKYLGFDDHYYRLISSFFDPNFAGLVLAIIALVFLINDKYLYFGISLISLVLTFSRASYLTLFLGLFLLYFIKKPKLLFTVFGLLLLLIFIAPKPFGEGVNLLRTFSIYSRLDSLKTGLNYFWQKPLLGWGYNTLTNLNGQRIGIDNSFVYLLATTGLFGFLTFGHLLVHVIRQLTTKSITILIVLILFHSLFNNSFFFIWINALFWVLVGLHSRVRE